MLRWKGLSSFASDDVSDNVVSVVVTILFSQFITETIAFPITREQPRDSLRGRSVVTIPMRRTIRAASFRECCLYRFPQDATLLTFSSDLQIRSIG